MCLFAQVPHIDTHVSIQIPLVSTRDKKKDRIRRLALKSSAIFWLLTFFDFFPSIEFQRFN